MKQTLALIFWCVLSFSAGWFGSQFKPGSWYLSINKPSWTPPSIVFPIAWSILYLLMGVSAWMVWKERTFNPSAKTALYVFLIQLALNALWSWIFFGLHQIGLALFEICALWLAILTTIYMFWRVSPVAGMLMVPYLAWVSFAVALNWAIWMQN